MKDLEAVFSRIKNLLESNIEWLLIHSSSQVFALQNNEIELDLQDKKILFSFLDEKGFQTWRIVHFAEEKNEVLLDLTRNFERENDKIRLIPRISAGDLSASIELARLEKANRTAAVIKENLQGEKLVRVSLNKENGRFAQIISENQQGQTNGVYI